jgi:hypothetical protein
LNRRSPDDGDPCHLGPRLSISAENVGASPTRRGGRAQTGGSCSAKRNAYELARVTAARLAITIGSMIHVLELAAYVFHPEGSPDAGPWLTERLLWLLGGEAGQLIIMAPKIDLFLIDRGGPSFTRPQTSIIQARLASMSRCEHGRC